MKYIHLFIVAIALMFLASTGLASASISDISPVKTGSCASLPQIESGSTYQNLTYIQQPNGYVDNIYLYMNKNGYSYTYSYCNTSQLGDYLVNGCSDVSCWSYKFSVTNTGKVQTTSQGINSIGYLLLMFCLMVFVGLVGWKLLEHENFWVVGIFLIVLCILMLVYNVWLGIEYRASYVGADNDSSIPQTFFYIFLTGLVAGLFMTLVIILKNWANIAKSFKKAVTGHDPDDDGWDGAMSVFDNHEMR